MKTTRKFKDYAMKHAKIRKDKKVKGFTLVELIIVIAIIGILAAILIPTMTGKVKDAKLKTANDAAAKIAEQAAICISEIEANGGSVSDGSYSASVTPFSSGDADVQKLKSEIEKALPSVKGAVWGVCIENKAVVAVVYAKSSTDKYIGQYPNLATDVSSAALTVNDDAFTAAKKS